MGLRILQSNVKTVEIPNLEPGILYGVQICQVFDVNEPEFPESLFAPQRITVQ